MLLLLLLMRGQCGHQRLVAPHSGCPSGAGGRGGVAQCGGGHHVGRWWGSRSRTTEYEAVKSGAGEQRAEGRVERTGEYSTVVAQ